MSVKFAMKFKFSAFYAVPMHMGGGLCAFQRSCPTVTRSTTSLHGCVVIIQAA